MTTIEELTAQKDGAYHERNQCVVALARLAIATGEGRAWLGYHSSGTWDEDWRNIVFIEVDQVGQMSWHIHDSELPLFAFLPRFNDRPWDGHSTPEKYRRLAEWHSMGMATP